MRDFGSTFKLQPVRPFLASRVMALALPAAATMPPLLLSTWGCYGFRRKGRRQRGDITRDNWELVQSGMGFLQVEYFGTDFARQGLGISLVI